MVNTAIELSVIVPTFNERDNVAEVVRRLDACLKSRNWEVIFVDDDSPDDTVSVAREIARRDPRVRCIQRIGRRGLSSACVEGMMSSSAPYLAVIDGDLQHDETLLPAMLDVLGADDTDIVVGSRYMTGGSLGDWAESRIRISRFAAKLSRLIVRSELTDPMSGFFMLRREVLTLTVRRLSTIGFKILLDIFASSPRPLKFKELPYEFRNRHAGESKLDNQVAWDFVMLLADKLFGRYVPVRFISFALVGGLGVIVHLLTVALFFKLVGLAFVAAQSIATLTAMSSNFVLNNVLTYRDMRLRGWQWLSGWVSFVLVCSVGAIANVAVAAYLFQINVGWFPAALGGIVIGAVWNYAISRAFTWNKPKTV